MTGPRYALREAVRLGWKHATIIARTFESEPHYDLRCGGVTICRVPEQQIKPLVANDGGEDG